MTGDFCGDYYTVTPNVSALVTATGYGTTFTSGTAYIYYSGVSAGGPGGPCGQIHSSGIFGVPSSSVSSYRYFLPGPNVTDSAELAPLYSFNFADLPPNPVPAAAWSGQASCVDNLGESAVDCSTITEANYAPEINVLSFLTYLDPAWSNCDFGGGVVDPPYALSQAAFAAAPAPSPTAPVTDSQSSPTAPATPGSPPPAHPSKTSSPSAGNPGPAQGTHQPLSKPPPAGSPPPLNNPVGANDPPAPNNPAASNGLKAPSAQQASAGPASKIGSLLGNSPTNAPSVPVQPLSSNEVASIVTIGLSNPVGFLTQNLASTRPIATIGGLPVAKGSSGGVLIDGTSLQPGSSTLIDNTPVAVQSDAVVVGGGVPSTIAISKNEGFPITQVGGQPISVDSNGGYVIGGSTMQAGGEITIDDTLISVGRSNVVVGDSTIFAPPSVGPKPGATIGQIGNQPLIAESPGGVVVGGQTIQPGQLATIDGTEVSAGSNGLVIPNTPKTLSFSNLASVDTDPLASAIADVADDAMGAGRGEIVPFSSSAEGDFAEGVDRGSEQAAVLTIGSWTLTVVEQTLPNGETIAILGPSTLTVGGSAQTINGETISAAVSGIEVISAGHISMMPFPAAPVPAAASARLTEAVLTLGSALVTATEEAAGSGQPSIVVIDGYTLTVGGAPVTVDGETISAGSAGLEIASGGHTVTDAYSTVPLQTEAAGPGDENAGAASIPGTTATAEATSPNLTQLSSEPARLHDRELHESSHAIPLRAPTPPPRSPSPRPLALAAMGGDDRPDGPKDKSKTAHLDRDEGGARRASGPPRPAMPPSVSAPPGRLPRLLPQDVSQYADSSLPVSAITSTSTSLAELAHLIRLQRYQEQRRCQSRVRLHRWLVCSALSARLVHCADLAHKTLVDHFRSEDKKSFAALYNAIHDVRSSCDATRRYALLEPDMEAPKTKPPTNERAMSFSTFMHEIPPKVRDELLHFLSEIRTNPDFLANRLVTLSQQELASITAFRHTMDPIESVMPLHSRTTAARTASSTKSSAHNNPTGGASLPSPVERLLSLQRHDPLSALLHTIFANSAGPDAAEDLRRTDVWASACARLITEHKPGSERFVMAVLDAWTAMREWPGKANLELYLMEILQDGQFLLEKAEEQSAKLRAQAEPASAKESIAAEEFYDRAVCRLFEVIDGEPGVGGLPAGALEIGTAMIRKLELSNSKSPRLAAPYFIVSLWFFSTFLLNAIIHPESQCLMMGYHITEHARQRILKEVAVRAQKLVLDVTYRWKEALPVLPEIRTHIENIVAHFKNTRGQTSKPVLLRAQAITSPRETVEVQPFLVISPADIMTLVNTLFPERRPTSMQSEREIPRGLNSSASSISGLSLFQPKNGSGDASSILSLGASSMTSETTSREPLLEGDSRPVQDDGADGQQRMVSSEDYGRKIRSACSEMSRVLGFEATAGSCHPCAERWAVLYVSPDGKELKTRMRKDGGDEDDLDDESPESDSEDEGYSERIDLESDYHQLKDAITKLVEDYEIPKELAPEAESKGFSNRTNKSRRVIRAMRSRTSDAAVPTGRLGSKNPYSNAGLASASTSSLITTEVQRRSPGTLRDANKQGRDVLSDPPSVLITMLEAAMNQSHARSDFVNAHLYYKTLQQLRRLASSSLIRDGYAPLLHYFSRGPRDSLGRCSSAIEEFEAWFVWLKQSQERHDNTVQDMITRVNTLRDKMWYITDVKNSASYEEAKNVAAALKTMGKPIQIQDGKAVPMARPRNLSKNGTANFLLKTESQVLDVLATKPDYGGLNKLSDEQCNITAKWIRQSNLENFCKGEERIHRFCLEIDRCVNKLVGDGILEGPVLWSSELFRRDKDILDSGRQKGDLFLTGVGTLSISGDDEYEVHRRPNSRSLDFAPRPGSRDLRAVSAQNHSQQSFDSSRWSTSRTSDIMDSQDYFGSLSPKPTIDSSATFWSPFQTTVQSPTSSTSIRPRTASSGSGTVMLRNSAAVSDDKRRFLLDLKQTVTGLLLSDLGTNVFGAGSETDAWFSGELGEECLQRKEAEDRRKKRLARKKSMKSLKSSRTDHRSGPLDTLGRGERGQPAAPIATLQHAGPEAVQSASEHSTSSDATARSSGTRQTKKDGLVEFPFNTAFRRLLHRFATHPNPFSKLNALYELELLIVASLSSRTGRGSRRDTLPTVPQSPTLGATPELSSREATVQNAPANTLNDAIANCESRRAFMLASEPMAKSTLHRHHTSGTASPSTGTPSTDMIVEILQSLFRDAAIRPKTLFRDLQYIASFVPAALLDKTARGKAFWDAGLAALGLKQDVVRIMVELADDIVAYHTNQRAYSTASHNTNANANANNTSSASASSNDPSAPSTTSSSDSQMPASTTTSTVTSSAHPPPASAPPPPPDLADDELARYSMSDAAAMLAITAREGDAVAARELATFYLTHPDLLPRTTLPLTPPRDVFKEALEDVYTRKKGTASSAADRARCDPMTMCVAHHWMEWSSRAGDALARKYLRARDEIERIP
ncbi:MAG: hypothetical protein M1822_005437 [Bathelium mastoideum]|nr:MAG: hypothetical protein M1822_005437 [Bathelium mastoideum]